MQEKTRYIVLFYDHCDRFPLYETVVVRSVDPYYSGLCENFQQLLDHLDNRLPDLIVVYVNTPEKRYIDHLKSLRVNIGIDEIPVYVFNELPEKQTLIDLMK